MAELVNLRTVRKQAKRRQDSKRANAARLAHGQPKRMRDLAAAEQKAADRLLDQHRLEPGDGR